MTDPVELSPPVLKDNPLPAPGEDSHKDAHGRVVVFGGSEQTPGAAFLAGLAALRAGAGKLRFVAGEGYARHLALAMPEARVTPAPVAAQGEISAVAARMLAKDLAAAGALVIGPGTLDAPAAAALAREALGAAPQTRCVVDAAAMTGLAGTPEPEALLARRAVLTPHPGEMARLMGAEIGYVLDHPADTALEAARRFQAVTCLKGRQTHVASPDGRLWRNSAGASGLGVCGSGDVLAGVIGGLLAQGAGPEAAALWGVWLHAQAGRALTASIGPRGFLAREVADRIPAERAAAEAA